MWFEMSFFHEFPARFARKSWGQQGTSRFPDGVCQEKESMGTLPKTNMDTQNDGSEKVTPFKNGNFWYLC